MRWQVDGLTITRYMVTLLLVGLLVMPATPARAAESLLPSLFNDGESQPDETPKAPEPTHPDVDMSAPGVADCPNAKPDAYIYVPDPIYHWAKLECRDDGNYLVAAPGYDWRTTAGEPFEVFSGSEQDLVAVRGERPYFTAMGVQQFDTGKALLALNLLDALVGQQLVGQRVDVDKSRFDDYWRLYMETKGKLQVDMYFFLSQGIPQYFVYCENKCASGRKPQIIRIIASSDVIKQQQQQPQGTQ